MAKKASSPVRSNERLAMMFPPPKKKKKLPLTPRPSQNLPERVLGVDAHGLQLQRPAPGEPEVHLRGTEDLVHHLTSPSYRVGWHCLNGAHGGIRWIHMGIQEGWDRIESRFGAQLG